MKMSEALLQTIIKEISQMKENMVTKKDIQFMATKSDITNMAMKDDMKNLASWVERIEGDIKSNTDRIDLMIQKIDTKRQQIEHGNKQWETNEQKNERK